MTHPAWVEEIKGQFKGKLFLNFEETMRALQCSRDTVYERLSAGQLVAHNPAGTPGRNGTRIVASSVWNFLAAGTICKEHWNE